MFPTRLIRTTSFRLTAVYLALFMLSTLALGVMVYVSVRREILAEFDDRIVAEADALNGVFVREGRDRLAAIIGARGAGGGSFGYGLQGPDGKRLAGELAFPAGAGQAGPARWFEMQEFERGEPPKRNRKSARACQSPPLEADRRRRAGPSTRRSTAFVGFRLGDRNDRRPGIVEGLWLSAQFLSRIDAVLRKEERARALSLRRAHRQLDRLFTPTVGACMSPIRDHDLRAGDYDLTAANCPASGLRDASGTGLSRRIDRRQRRLSWTTAWRAVDLAEIARETAHLLDNALRHTPAGARSRSPCANTPGVRLSIADNGLPFAPTVKLDLRASIAGILRAPRGEAAGIQPCRRHRRIARTRMLGFGQSSRPPDHTCERRGG